jgi:hydroxyacylglutathione hydrolase
VQIVVEREDNFSDIMRKASSGTQTAPPALARATAIDPKRLELIGDDANPPTEEEARAVARALRLDPDKLADIARRDWKPKPQEQAEHIGHQFNAPFFSNGYFLIEPEERIAAIVDPGGAAGNIVAVLRRSGADLAYILLTHKHHDHVDAVPEVRAAFPQARVVVNRLDAPAIGDLARNALEPNDGENIPFGAGGIRFVHTPGHTDGSSCFVYRGTVFTGDTMFAGSVGRVFDERYGYDDLLESVRTKLFTLPAETVVLPGHGPPSTIAEERAHNPFF